MLIRTKKTFTRYAGCDAGATLVEYGMALTLAIAVGVTALGFLGLAINGKITEAADVYDE